MSVAYPLARALPILLTALITELFGLGQAMGLVANLGMAVIAAGVCTSLLRAAKAMHGNDLWKEKTPLREADAPDLPHYEIVTSQAAASAETPQVQDLRERLIQTGKRAVLATLPEGSSIAPKPELTLTGEREATLAGEVAIPAQNGAPQRSYAFQIKLDYLPEDDAEPPIPGVSGNRKAITAQEFAFCGKRCYTIFQYKKRKKTGKYDGQSGFG